MNQTATSDVLMLEEAASYLKLPLETIEREASRGRIPGRRIEDAWRFLKSATDKPVPFLNRVFITSMCLRRCSAEGDHIYCNLSSWMCQSHSVQINPFGTIGILFPKNTELRSDRNKDSWCHY